jgi:hypothetical protein
MEVRRRLRKNKINNNIRDAEVFMTRSTNTIQRIKTSQMGEEYIRNQIDKLKSAIGEKNKLVAKLREELIYISAGFMDDTIKEEYKDSEMNIKKQNIESTKIKAMKKEASDEKKDVSQKYWKGIIDESRNHRQKDRDVNHAYKYFKKVNDSLPDYMINNLAEMPNNKGYIWRGVHFYGDLQEQRGPRVMFEKQRGGILVINEYTDSEYRRYEKKGKDRKQLIHKEFKKPKKLGIDLMDYVVKK